MQPVSVDHLIPSGDALFSSSQRLAGDPDRPAVSKKTSLKKSKSSSSSKTKRHKKRYAICLSSIETDDVASTATACANAFGLYDIVDILDFTHLVVDKPVRTL